MNWFDCCPINPIIKLEGDITINCVKCCSDNIEYNKKKHITNSKGECFKCRECGKSFTYNEGVLQE